MAQQQLMRIKAKKMFKVSLGGALPVMVNPGDVVEVDRFMAGMMVQSEKADVTQDKLFVNPDYKAPERVSVSNDPVSLLTRTVENLTRIVQEMIGRQKSH